MDIKTLTTRSGISNSTKQKLRQQLSLLTDGADCLLVDAPGAQGVELLLLSKQPDLTL